MFRFFRRNKVFAGDRIDLIQEQKRISYDGEILAVIFTVCLRGRNEKIGECDLRIGMNRELYYAGNIGYRIFPPYRGHGYAYDACRMLLKIAKEEYNMKEILITCSPDNIPSRRTIEKAGFQFVDKVNVPADHYLYLRGEKIKNRYILNL